jgi:hypothetical protein
MNRMLYLRDLDVDVLIRCRACGHEGLLPHAEATRRFGPAYPVLSIAPHYRCSRCNARDAESSAAPEPDFPYATPHAANEDDGGFAAALASLQNLVEAAHSRPEPPRRKPVPEPDASPFSPVPEFAPESEDPPSFDPPSFDAASFETPSFETPPVAAAWDEAEEAAARAAWDAAPVWEPAETRREEPPRRRRETPAMPVRPFVPSRERRPARNEEDEALAPPPRAFDSPPADSPPAGQSAMLSLADIRALLGEDDDEDEKPPEAVAPAPQAEEDVLALWDRDMAADGDFEEKADTAWMSDALSQAPSPADEDDEDDPLLSNTLQRLLRNAHADDEAEADDMPSPDMAEADEETTGDAVAAALGGIAEEEPELSDDELLAFAIGDRDAETSVADLPPELAALLAEGEDLREEPGDGLSDEDEDEVYEYTPDEIIAGVDAVGEEGEPVDPSVWAQIAPPAPEPIGEAAPQEDAQEETEPAAEFEPAPEAWGEPTPAAPAQEAEEAAEAESWFPPAWDEALDETLRAAAQATEDALVEDALVEDALVEDALVEDAVVAEEETETSSAAVGDEEEPILLDEPVAPEPLAETPPRFALGAVEEDPAHDADLAALRALLAQTGGDDDDDDEEEPDFALPPRPARDPLIDDGEDDRDGEEPAAPPAWRTQGPPPAEEGEEGMEDALATLRALIEQAAAEPEPDLEPAFPPPAPDAPAPTELTDEVDVDFPPPPAFASRPAPSPIDEDDPEAWAALMREVKAKATEDDADADATLPLRGPSPAPSASPSAGAAIDMTATKRGGSLDDTLSRLRGLLDLPPGDPPSSRGRGRRKS